MYNIWKSDRDLHAVNRSELHKKIEAGRSSSNRERQEKLVQNYKKRIENFVMQMLDKPIKQNQFIGHQDHKFRDEDVSRFKGGSRISIKSFKTERDRISESLERHNTEYKSDHVSFAAHEYRSRNQSKEIQPQMRFSTKSGLDRIIHRIGATPNNLDSEGRRLDQNDSFLLELQKSPVTATNKYIAKHFMPELHQKTHFKAATSLYLGLPDNLVGKDLMNLKKPTRTRGHPLSLDLGVAKLNATVEEEGPDTGLRGRRMQKIKGFDDALTRDSTLGGENEEGQKANAKRFNIDTINPSDVSRQVLLDCNVIRTKLPSVRTLHVGDGHLSMMSQKSMRDVYHEIYHKDLSTIRKA